MNVIEHAFTELFPEKTFSYTPVLQYSGRFKGYNANIRLNKVTKVMTVSLSKQWRHVSKEIQTGLVQEMLCRLFKKKAKTTNMDLYKHFLRSVHITVPKTKSHPVLEQSFFRVNESFFDGLIEQPNLVLGKGLRTLGHYDYGSDTVTISEHLFDDYELLDYVMYHELLHKKHKFTSGGRHHTKAFKEDEAKFPNAAVLEKRLGRTVKKKSWLKQLLG